MSVIFQVLLNSFKFSTLQKSLKYTSSHSKCLFSKYSGSPKKFITFDEVVAQRRAEARRSLVIQVNSKSSFNELYSYCSKYADIEGVHHYINRAGEHFMLIEFQTENNVKDIIKNCASHHNNMESIAVPSPFLWFRAMPNKTEPSGTPNTTLITSDGSSIIDQDSIIEDLMKCDSVSQQIQLLYDRTSLNDIGTRLRYMVARQLEMVFNSLYANVELWPFGSSVNGFGKIGCDLDLVMTNNITEDMCRSTNRLVYQEKHHTVGTTNTLETIAQVLEDRVAGTARVTRVLHARVPILKYSHDLVHLDCDLSYNLMSGVYMSEFLYIMGAWDARVRPLTFAVRRWASSRSLTCPRPGRWITNFALTLMVVAFLQQNKVLPPLNLLVKAARKEDIRKGEDNLNCTYLRDINVLPRADTNTDSMETLLLKFYEHYSQFDFLNKAISVIEGSAVRKPNNQPLYIINPLNVGLNVSKNVSFEECERFRLEVRNAAWQLDAVHEKEKTDNWGLLSLSESSTDWSLKKLVKVGNSHRLVSLKDLFKADELDRDELKSNLDKLSAKISLSKKNDGEDSGKSEYKLKFKNNQVRNEVMRIRRNKMS